MYGVRRAQAGGALEHIDIRLPAGGNDDDDDDEEEGGGDGNTPNAGGVIGHQLQLRPLPADATREEIVQAYREAQLQNQAQSEELASRLVTQAQSSKAARAADKDGGRAPRDPPPPPELVDVAKKIGELGREYAVLISPWPPVSCWPFITHERPDVDPYDPAQRYPGFGAGAVRIRSRHGQEALADPALRNAVIAELYDFTGALSIHLTNTWFQKKFAKAVNGRKSHMLDDLRANRANVFAGLPGVDPAVLHSNDLARIRNDPAIKQYIGSSGTSKKWPDLFYRPGKEGNIKHLFRVEWLPRAMKLMCHGRKSLTVGHAPRTNVSAVKWGVNEVTYGFIAGGAVGMLHLLSGDPSVETTAGPSGFVYPHMFAQIVEHLIKTRDRRLTDNLFDWLNEKVFGSINSEAAQPSAGQQAEDEEEEEDFDKLDEPDSDEESVPRDAPPSARSSSRSGTYSESMSSRSQIVPAVPPSTQPYISPPPQSDISHRPAASTSASSILSYAPIPAAPSSSSSPSQRPMSPPLPPISYAYQPQLADQQLECVPQVIPLPGALSDVFLGSTVSGGYVVAAHHSSNHGTSLPGSAGPAPVLRAAGAPIPRGLHAPVAPAPAPTAHVSDPRAVPSPIPASVTPAVTPVNHAALPLRSTSTSTSHSPQPGTSTPPVNSTGVNQLEELSEAASHLNVGSGKRKAARGKSTTSAPTKNPAPAPSRYSTRVRKT